MSALVKHDKRSQPILVEELPRDLTAWDVCQKLAAWPHLLFLDSAQNEAAAQLRTLGVLSGRPLPYTPLPTSYAPFARYSFVTADPFAWIWSRGRRVFSGDDVLLTWGDPFTVLEDKLAEYPMATLPNLPPFQGGAAGLWGYDLCQHLERLPRPTHDDFAVPDLAVGFYDWVASFDHKTKRAWLIATGYPEKDPRERRRHARPPAGGSETPAGPGPPPTLPWRQQAPAAVGQPALAGAGAARGVFSNFNQ